MRNRQAFALAWVLALAGAASVGGESRPPVTFAILREDGILIPVATFDGKWKNRWPQPAAEAEVPITLGDVPKSWWPDGRIQREWTFWAPDGASRRLAAIAPVWVRAQCVSNVGLRTDFKSELALPDPETMPYPKAGLATSAGPEAVKVEPIAVLDPSLEEWKDVVASLNRSFFEVEGKAIDASSWWPLVSGTRYSLAPTIRVEALYRSADLVPGRDVFYFEASRRHPGRFLADPACELIAYASGWIRAPRGRREVRTEVEFTDCDRRYVRFMYPLAMVRVHDGRPLWFVQWSTWQAEWYTVIDITGRTEPSVLFETWGGGCR